MLRVIGRHRVDVAGLGKAACLGTYAQVLTPGTVSVGESATVLVA
jgi:MOSC domain-containing protein YiiM